MSMNDRITKLKIALDLCGRAASGCRYVMRDHASARDLDREGDMSSGTEYGIRVNTVGSIVREALKEDKELAKTAIETFADAARDRTYDQKAEEEFHKELFEGTDRSEWFTDEAIAERVRDAASVFNGAVVDAMKRGINVETDANEVNGNITINRITTEIDL